MTTARPWSRRYEACRRCGGTGDPHNARGYCHPCYNVLYEAGELAGTWRSGNHAEARRESYEDSMVDLWHVEREAAWLLWHARLGHPVPPVDVVLRVRR